MAVKLRSPPLSRRLLLDPDDPEVCRPAREPHTACTANEPRCRCPSCWSARPLSDKSRRVVGRRRDAVRMDELRASRGVSNVGPCPYVRAQIRASGQGRARSVRAPPGREVRRARASRSSPVAATRVGPRWRCASRRRSPQQLVDRLGRASPYFGAHAQRGRLEASRVRGAARQNQVSTRRSWVLLPFAQRIVGAALPAPRSG